MESERGETRLGAYAFCVRADGAVLLARMAPDSPDAGSSTCPEAVSSSESTLMTPCYGNYVKKPA